MKKPFRRADLVAAALQRRGAPRAFVRRFIRQLEKLARSPAEYRKWNRVLDHQEALLLGRIVAPEGRELADSILTDVFASICLHYDIAEGELRTAASFN